MLNEAAFLTTRELAVALHVCEHTILRQAKKGTLRGQRVGKLWRFPKTLLDAPAPVGESKAMKKLMRLL